MASKKNKIFKQWSKVFFITLLLVFLLQTFFIQLFTVTSTSMESSIHKGDKVWVNKLAYGIRLPITLISIPFVHNKIFGLQSYIITPSFSYHRLLSKKIKINDIVLINNPLDIEKPLDKRDLLLSRCIAVPGDTLFVNNEEIIINGNHHPLSPDIMMNYKIEKNASLLIDSLIKQNNISVVKNTDKEKQNSISLSRYQAHIINESLPDSLKLLPELLSTKNYSFIVPNKGLTIDINNRSLSVFSDVIKKENSTVIINSTSLLLNDSILTQYTFKYDYYWFLSDNQSSALDSRTFGFVSEKDVVGKVIYISH